MNTCFADDVRDTRATPENRDVAKGCEEVGHEFQWVCRIGGSVVGRVGLRQDGLNSARICFFRVDPEWQHTSVPRKLIQCVRGHTRSQGVTRIMMEPRVVPRWLLQSLRRRGLRLAGYANPFGKLILEFRDECAT